MDASDAAGLGVSEGEWVLLVSRRGAVRAPVCFDPALRPGLASITPHFSEQVDTNVITNDAWDPKSGTSEFKATAVRIEKLPVQRAEAVLPAAGH
jgi:formate dehydrogenase major subunit